jgi:hypothetical protein
LAIGEDARIVAVKGVGEHIGAKLFKDLALVGKVVVVDIGTPEAVVKVEDLGRRRIGGSGWGWEGELLSC